MQVPSDALLMTPLGRAIQSHTDVGNPRRGIYREEHPASTHDYWDAHNEHFKKTDMELGEMIQCSPAISNGALYVRSNKRIWKIARKTQL